MSLVKKSNPNTVYTTQKQNKLQQTKHRGVYQKKKKKSPIHKPKPNPSKPNPVTHSHVTAARSSSSSLSLAPHRRSQIVDQRLQIALPLLRCSVLGAPSGPPSRYFSLFLSDSLSVSLSLSHLNEKIK